VLIELPITHLILLNIGGWLTVQLGLAWAFTKMPEAWFASGKVYNWEQHGRFYERFFCIKVWKKLLPDAASWFAGGFPKGALAGIDREYLQRFVRETWRGELCHWCAVACAPLFLLWNPWWGELIIITYALMANMPCILSQRYNRARILRLLARSA